ncbi:hypothetical protein ACFE04_029723 [Oxalis oulophora]
MSDDAPTVVDVPVIAPAIVPPIAPPVFPAIPRPSVPLPPRPPAFIPAVGSVWFVRYWFGLVRSKLAGWFVFFGLLVVWVRFGSVDIVSIISLHSYQPLCVVYSSTL